jgi:hypothetical protein
MGEHEALTKMRACTKWAFEHGVEGGQKDPEWIKFRHAIIFECKRIGIDRAETKQMILEWNVRNMHSLSPNDAKRQLCGYVDWLYKMDNAKLSCNALKDYCISNDVFCIFAKKEAIKPLSFTLADACSFLEKTTKNGYILGKILKLMLSLREELKVEQLFVGSRRLCELFFDREGINLQSRIIVRHLWKLSDLGFLSIESGEAGTFGRKANAYKLLEWKPERCTALYA